MKKLNLMLHCGANSVDRDAVENCRTPLGTHTHTPIPHRELLDRVTNLVQSRGMKVIEEAHGMTHDGNRYFGMMQVAMGQHADDYGLVLGVRNSHDKSFPAAIALGAGVFVCDNLSFSGEIKLARKHTRYILRDLSQVVSRAVGMLGDHRQKQDERIAAYKEHDLKDINAHDLLIAALDCQAIPSTKIPHVLKEWRKPSHEAFEPRTAWSMFNAFTEVLKGDVRKALPRTQALHGLMDSICKLSA